jgi:hypothetical protein
MPIIGAVAPVIVVAVVVVVVVVAAWKSSKGISG